jgi:alkyl hydroperoxide reductase subunit AhpC
MPIQVVETEKTLQKNSVKLLILSFSPSISKRSFKKEIKDTEKIGIPLLIDKPFVHKIVLLGHV